MLVRRILRVIAIIALVLIVLLGVAWLGFRIPAPRYPEVEAPGASGRLPLPADLPAPVMRYVRAVFGDSLPQVESAIAVGRATISMNGLVMPVRFRIYYDAQRGYYHDMQATWFTLPILSVNERYLDGVSTIDIPIIGYSNDDPKTNAAARQGFWSEMLAWVPAIVFADPRIMWEAIDENSARMILPDADQTENFTITFDPETGLMSTLTTLRYQGAESTERTLWQNQITEWGELNGIRVPVRSSTQWADAAPWAQWEIEQVALNAAVTERMEHFGS